MSNAEWVNVFHPRPLTTAGFRLQGAHYDFSSPHEHQHTDWKTTPNYDLSRPRPDLTPAQEAEVVHEWRPPHGESHIYYSIIPNFPLEKTLPWGATHHGIYQGSSNVTDKDGNTIFGADFPVKSYKYLGDYPSVEHAKAAVEKYHNKTYKSSPPPDYDINQIMRDQQ